MTTRSDIQFAAGALLEAVFGVPQRRTAQASISSWTITVHRDETMSVGQVAETVVTGFGTRVALAVEIALSIERNGFYDITAEMSWPDAWSLCEALRRQGLTATVNNT